MKIFGLLILLVFLTTTQTHSFRLPMPYGTGFPHFNWYKPNKGITNFITLYLTFTYLFSNYFRLFSWTWKSSWNNEQSSKLVISFIANEASRVLCFITNKASKKWKLKRDLDSTKTIWFCVTLCNTYSWFKILLKQWKIDE